MHPPDVLAWVWVTGVWGRGSGSHPGGWEALAPGNALCLAELSLSSQTHRLRPWPLVLVSLMFLSKATHRSFIFFFSRKLIRSD